MAKKYTADTFEGGAGNLTSLAVNTDDLVAGGGSVGIGTSSPSVPLTVQSNSGGIAARLLGRSSDGYAFFTFRNNADSATNGEIGVSDSQNMLFYTGASERMRIDSSGNVGINDSSPSYLFNIKGTEERIGIKDTSAGETWNNTDLGGFVFRTHYATQEKTGMYAVGLPHGTGVNYQPQLEFKTSNTTRLTINPNGNVGIGTTDPTSKLQVEHADFARLDLNLSNSSGTTIADVRGLVSGTEKWRIGKTGSSSDDFTINVTGSERMRIDSSGNVGIGASNPQKKLVISESTNATIRINSTKNGTWTSEEGLGHLEFSAMTLRAKVRR